jgi:hypothetical protein
MKNNFTWNKESEYSIYDAIDDWGYHKFACVMKDGTLEEFTGVWDEDCEDHNHLHIEDITGMYSTDDIVMWIEIPNLGREEM